MEKTYQYNRKKLLLKPDDLDKFLSVLKNEWEPHH